MARGSLLAGFGKHKRETYQWNKRQPVPTNQVQPPVKRSNAHCNAIAWRTVARDEKSDFTRYMRDFHKCGVLWCETLVRRDLRECS
jgi:hypothetical protein